MLSSGLRALGSFSVVLVPRGATCSDKACPGSHPGERGGGRQPSLSTYLGARLCAWWASLNPCLALSFLYAQGNQGSERGSVLPEATQLASVSAGVSPGPPDLSPSVFLVAPHLAPLSLALASLRTAPCPSSLLLPLPRPRWAEWLFLSPGGCGARAPAMHAEDSGYTCNLQRPRTVTGQTEHRLGVGQTCVLVSALLFPCCVTLGTSPHLSELFNFFISRWGGIRTHPAGRMGQMREMGQNVQRATYPVLGSQILPEEVERNREAQTACVCTL